MDTAAKRPDPRAAIPDLRPLPRTPHHLLPQRGFVHRNGRRGYSGNAILYPKPKLNSTD